MTNSNQKGKRGELEAAHLLNKHGFPAERGKQYQGGHDSPDVRCPRLNEMGIQIEVKRVERLRIHEAVKQAKSDAGNDKAVVLHRKNGEEWLATMTADHYLTLIDVLDREAKHERRVG